MLEIVLKREMLQKETLRGPTTIIVASATPSYERRDDIRRNERRRVPPDDHEDSFHPPKRLRNSMYESNATNQSEYILTFALSN